MSDTWKNRETQQKDAQNGYMFTYTDDFLKLFLFLIGQQKKKKKKINIVLGHCNR